MCPCCPLKMCPGLDSSCASCLPPKCASWPQMLSTKPSSTLPPASTFLADTGKILFSWSSRFLGRKWTQELLHEKTKRLGDWFLPTPPSTAGIHLIGLLRIWKIWVLFSFWMTLPHLHFPTRWVCYVVSFTYHLGSDDDDFVCLLSHIFVSNKSPVSVWHPPSCPNPCMCLSLTVLALDEGCPVLPKVTPVSHLRSPQKEIIWSHHRHHVSCSTKTERGWACALLVLAVMPHLMHGSLVHFYASCSAFLSLGFSQLTVTVTKHPLWWPLNNWEWITSFGQQRIWTR